MWFKTKAGLIRIEGTVQFFAATYGDGRFAGVYALQRQHRERQATHWFRKAPDADYAYLYVACFQNDVHAQRRITQVFSMIEAAIRNGEPICDLTQVGDDEAWHRPDWAFLAGWIGFTWIARPYQRTAVNPECKYMLLRHAFDDQGAVRVQLKTDLRNVNSQGAIEKLGAVREGVLRKHMVLPDGYIRDTVMYGITAEDWPELRRRLEARLGYVP